jgi:HK97 family phage prohead protease
MKNPSFVPAIERREAPIVSHDARSRTVTVLASSEVEDRYGSVIRQRGLRYRQSLPVLVGHDGSPVARTSRVWLGQDDGVPATLASIQFPPEGDVPEADDAYTRIRHGLLDSVSIGFFIEDTRSGANGVTEITQAEIAEISLVAVPANPRAQVLAVNRPPAYATREQPAEEEVLPVRRDMRVIAPAPAILERKSALDSVTLFDFAALASDDLRSQSKRDLGPARDWAQWLNEMEGSRPDRGVRFPLALLYWQGRERDRAPHKRAGELETVTLMRGMLDDLVAAMRRESYFGVLGVPTPMADEAIYRVPSTATQGSASIWIAKDAAASVGTIPTFALIDATPHTLSTDYVIPRSLLLYSGGLGEQVVRREIMRSHLEAQMVAYLFGDSAVTANQPDGLFKKLTVAGFPAASQVMERIDLLTFISTIETSALADRSGVDLRWFMPIAYKRQMEMQPAFPDVTRRSDMTILPPDSPNAGTMLGYPYATSNFLRWTQGAGLHDCDLVFGDFSQSWWVSWQSAVVMSNPYSADPAGFRAGGVELLILSDHDFQTRDVARLTWTNRVTQAITP